MIRQCGRFHCLHKPGQLQNVAIIFLLALATCWPTSAHGGTYFVSSGQGFAAGVADPDVDAVVLLNDVVLRDSDWDGHVTPIPLLRNVTISGNGTEESPDSWPLLDINNVSDKMRLGDGITLSFQKLVFTRFRQKRLILLSPGTDLLAPCLPNEQGIMEVKNCLAIQDLCYPPDIQRDSQSTAIRPPLFPGNQTSLNFLPQPGCVNTSSLGGAAGVPLARQCWLFKGEWVDMAYVGAISNTAQQQVHTGYLVHCVFTYFVCREMLTKECIRSLGQVGCLHAWGAGALPPPAPPPSPPSQADVVSTSDGGGDGGGSSGVPLGPVLGGVLGGAAVLLCVAAVVVLVVRQRRQRTWRINYLQKQNATASGTDQNPGEQGSEDEDKEDEEGGLKEGGTCGGRGTGQQCVAAGPARHMAASATAAPLHGKLHSRIPATRPLMDATVQPSATIVSQETRASQGSQVPLRCRSDEPVPCQASNMDSERSERDVKAALASVDPFMVVTPLMPQRPDFRLDMEPSNEVKLLSRTLGKGAYGKVVEGEYQGQRVAVKMLVNCTLDGWGLGAVHHGDGGEENTAADCADGGGNCNEDGAMDVLIASLEQEVQVLGRCQHPNIVRLLAACLAPPRMCLVMELMETSLEGLLYGKPGELLPMPMVLNIALDVARGLEYMHPTIVHRDLKPGNVLVNLQLGPSPVAKLSDFGLSRLRSTVVPTQNPEAGTPQYMAPELFDIGCFMITHKVDVFSYGVLLWAMLTGRLPWQGVPLVTMAYTVAVSRGRLPLDKVIKGRDNPKLLRLMHICWEHDPLRRPAAAEIVKQLLLVQEQVHAKAW